MSNPYTFSYGFKVLHSIPNFTSFVAASLNKRRMNMTDDALNNRKDVSI